MYKVVSEFKEMNQDAYKVVDAFRKRPKLMADWRAYQSECGAPVLAFIKARQERMASKHAMSERLDRVKNTHPVYPQVAIQEAVLPKGC